MGFQLTKTDFSGMNDTMKINSALGYRWLAYWLAYLRVVSLNAW